MKGATFSKNNLDPQLFIGDDTPQSWCAYLLHENETYEEDQIDFKTIWDGTGNWGLTKYRGEFLFSTKTPASLESGSEEDLKNYIQQLREVIDDKINTVYSIGLVWLIEPDAVPTENNVFLIPLWEQSSRHYQIAMKTNFSFGNGIGTFTAYEAVAAKKEINGDYSAIQLPTTSSQGLTNRPNPIEFGLRLNDGEIPAARHSNQVLDNYISIPLNGEGCGCIRFGMGLKEEDDLMNMDIGQKYFYQNGSLKELHYPVFEFGRDGYEVYCQISLDPTNILNEPTASDSQRPQRTYIAFAGETEYTKNATVPNESTILDSHFLTETGHRLRLKPNLESYETEAEFNAHMATNKGARLVFSKKLTNQEEYYYAPAGEFFMGYDPEKSPKNLEDTSTQLLAGLSGTESIGCQASFRENPEIGEIITGNRLYFKPYSPSFATGFPFENMNESNHQCEPELTEAAHTSWVNVITENPEEPILYYAQSEGASLFVKEEPTISESEEEAEIDIEIETEEELPIEVLDFFEPAIELPQGDFAIPLVPHLGTPIEDLHTDFEKKVISPVRKNEIAQQNPTNVIEGNSPVVRVTTPQGLIVKIDNDANEGLWKEVIFAENTESAIDSTTANYVNCQGLEVEPESPEFKFGFVNLTDQLQKVFQSNQQFLVATNANNLGTLFTDLTGHRLNYTNRTTSFFNNKMYINDWPFEIKTGQNGAVDGEYRNVLICKFCQGSLLERIQNPILWTQPCDFNSEADLYNIASWLQTYLTSEQIETDPYYEHFKKIINDSNWNGILALKVDLNASNFPQNLQGLLAGMDTDALNIHHFGIEVNHVDTSSDLKIKENSSLFGLIDYQDEDYKSQIIAGTSQNPNVSLDEGGNIADLPVQDDTNPYDFRVLTLRVLFENSDIKDFASKIQVTLNNLMKDQVIKVNIDGVGDIDGTSLTPDYNDLSYSLILDGTYEEVDGKSVYTFSSDKSNKFYLDSNIIDYFEIERALFETLSSVNGHIESIFRFNGNINFKVLYDDPNNPTASLDIFSFGNEDVDSVSRKGLSFTNLFLEMEFDLPDESNDLEGPTAPAFEMNHQDFGFNIQDSYAREESLFAKFPIDFQGFIFGSSDQSPSSLGYLGVNTFGSEQVDLTDEWFGLKYKLSLGSLGDMASNAGLEAKLLVAWSPIDTVGSSSYKTFLGLALPSIGGDSKMLNLQGLLNVGIREIAMEYLPGDTEEDPGAYVLRLNDIGFKFFNTVQLPLTSTTSFHLFANANDTSSKNLGWLLAHGQENSLPVGSGMIDLPLLAMGQRVSLNAGDVENMTDAIEKMRNAFFPYVGGDLEHDFENGWNLSVEHFIKGSKGGDEVTLGLDFNEESNWLIAFKFGLLGTYGQHQEENDDGEIIDVDSDFSIELSVLFNDPDIYGARLALGGHLASVFDGLEFEILYKKVTDSIGVYQTELVLPSKFRTFKAGAATITLPVLALDIYTNGDFKVDLGFPYDLDFSRSFSMEVQAGPFPLIGSGGLYFGKLSAATAKNTPETSLGVFDPVFIFGIGAEVGFGKSFEEGPLSASFKITLVGLLEGVIASFIPNERPEEVSNNIENSYYFKLDGTFGIVGILEGEVDFEVIKAGVYVEVYALVNAILEAYEDIPIELKAGVEVEVTVEIDVWVGTIEIEFSFSEEIKEEFVITSPQKGTAPWDDGSGRVAMAASRSMASRQMRATLNANPTVELKKTMDLYLTLQSTAGDAVPSMVAMLMLHNPSTIAEDAPARFKELALDVFDWVIRSFVPPSEDVEGDVETEPEIIVTLEDIEAAINYFQNNGITKDQANGFLNAYYDLQIKALSSSDDCVKPAIFPMIPSLKLSFITKTIDADDTIEVLNPDRDDITFDDFSYATAAYLKELNDYFKNPSDDFEADAVEATSSDTSLAQWLFQDYFKIIAKYLLNEAQKITSAPINLEDLIEALSATSTADNLAGMIGRYFMGGLRLPVLAGLGTEDDTIETGNDYGLYRLTGQQFALPATEYDGDKTLESFSVTLSDSNETSLIGGLDLTISHEFEDRIVGLQSDFSLDHTIIPLPSQKEVAKRFKFKSFHPWKNETSLDDSNHNIWYFSDSLLNHLIKNKETVKDFNFQVAKYNAATNELDYFDPTIQNYGTIVDLTIRRKAVPEEGTINFRYELIGTDEVGITLLENLLLDNSSIDRGIIQILYYELEGDSDMNKARLESLDIQSLYTFINRVNLSTETNPAEVRMAAARMAAAKTQTDGIMHEFPIEFLRFIWEASILRSGGYYLYYENETGTASLPEHIFNDDQTANLKILIPFTNANQPEHYHNCALTEQTISGIDTTTEDVQVFLEAQHLQYNVNMLPQSQIGYAFGRKQPESVGTAPHYNYDNLLAKLYHLLAYQVVDGDATTDDFKDGAMGVPVGPTKDIGTDDLITLLNTKNVEDGSEVEFDTSDWLYKLVVPLNNFANLNSDVSLLIEEKGAGEIEDKYHPNPYEGIGGKANLNFCWRDLYGNCANGSDGEFNLGDSFTLGYTDKLLPISQWANVSSQYYFEGEEGAYHLVVQLEFTPPTLPSQGSEEYDGYITEMKKQVAKTYYQISQMNGEVNHIDASIRSTFFDNDYALSTTEIGELQTFLCGIYDYFNDNENEHDLTVPIVEIKVPFSEMTVNNDGLFELNVQLMLERKEEYIDVKFVDSNEVSIAKSFIQPKLNFETYALTEELIENNRLKGFAQRFESIFAAKNLKIATGINKDDLNTNNKIKDIWIVDMHQMTANVTTGNPLYFALAPLSTKLESREVAVYDYTGNQLDLGSTTNISFSEIDIETWAQQFLEAVDHFLSPEMTTAAYLIDQLGATSYLSSIMSAKDTLATSIVSFLKPVFNISTGDQELEAAKEKLRQRLLIKLQNAHLINTVVQFPVDTGIGYSDNDSPVRLYGNPKIVSGGSKGDRNFIFSTSKIELTEEDNFLTFLFDTKHDTESSIATFDLEYQMTHLEFDIQKHGSDSQLNGYESSSWLAFVCPDSHLKKDLGTLDIPVVLRAYPQPLSLQKQEYIQSLKEADKSSLANATQWDYHFTYLQKVAAQDTVKAQVAFNLQPPEQLDAMRMTFRDLFDELATFNHLYKTIHQDLNTYLPQITANTDTGDDNFTKAKGSLEAFSSLVQNVANVWGSWSPTSSNIDDSTPLEGNIHLDFNIREDSLNDPGDGTGALQVIIDSVVKSESSGAPDFTFDLPNIAINDIPADESLSNEGTVDASNTISYNGLNWNESRGIPARRVQLENLNILELQNVISQITLTRNEYLSESTEIATNPAFVYHTPVIKFPNKLVPLLDNNDAIDIAQEVVGLSDKTLTNYLKAFFQKLFEEQTLTSQTIKLECSYIYKIREENTFPEIKLPILLIPPSVFKIPEGWDEADKESFLAKLVQNIEEWLAVNQPAEQNINGRLLFDLSVFSSLESSQLPILRLRNIFLRMEDL